jgi:hypothetical protein
VSQSGPHVTCYEASKTKRTSEPGTANSLSGPDLVIDEELVWYLAHDIFQFPEEDRVFRV